MPMSRWTRSRICRRCGAGTRASAAISGATRSTCAPKPFYSRPRWGSRAGWTSCCRTNAAASCSSSKRGRPMAACRSDSTAGRSTGTRHCLQRAGQTPPRIPAPPCCIVRRPAEPVATESGEWEYTFACENTSELREGDQILLSDGDPVTGAVVSGTVLRVDHRGITVWTPERIAHPRLLDRYGSDIVQLRTARNLWRWLEAEPRLRELVAR